MEIIDDIQPSIKPMNQVRSSFRFFGIFMSQNRRDKYIMFLAMLMLIVAKVITVVSPYTLKWAADTLAIQKQNAPQIDVLLNASVAVALYGLSRVVVSAVTQLRDGLLAHVTASAAKTLALRVFRHVLNLPMDFHVHRRMGELTRSLEKAHRGVEQISRAILNVFLPTLFELIFILVVFQYQFGGLYILITISTVGLYTFFTIVASRHRIATERNLNEKDVDAHAFAVDSLANVEVVKMFDGVNKECQRYSFALDRLETAQISIVKLHAILNFGQTGIFTVGLSLCLYLAVYRFWGAADAVGQLVLLNALLLQLAIPLNSLGNSYREVSQGLVELERARNLLNLPIEDGPKIIMPTEIASDIAIEFRNVSFWYEKSEPVLKNVTFTVGRGERVAIVGRSGAGKSTITKLLFRIHQRCSGLINVNGIDISAYELSSLRRKIGIVPQECGLFNDTLAYNICYGDAEENGDRLNLAVSVAQLETVVQRAPQGLETPVGDRGLLLSGGERQRVAIARVVSKNPEIVILDEATSSLDLLTEAHIESALSHLGQSRAVLVIAHRLSTITSADKIIVLSGGCIVEQGKHDALLQQCGEYAALWAQQSIRPKEQED